MELTEAIVISCLLSWSLGISLIVSIIVIAVISIVIRYSKRSGKISNPEQWSAVIGGAGCSGLCWAKKLKDIGLENFVILEKHKNLGGTWYLNRYPGVACDIASYLYSFSFFQNPDWSKAYSGGSEIQDYLMKFASHFDLHKHIMYEKEIDTVSWNEEIKKWDVFTTKGDKFTANFFFHGTGALHVPHKPHFQDQETFKGRIIHTAEWDESLDVNDKKVGVIGTGASAVQLVPSISNSVKELFLFQRTPAWVPRRHNFKNNKVIKFIFRTFPTLLELYRCLHYIRAELIFFALFLMDSKIRPLLKKYISWEMGLSLKGKAGLQDDLIPAFEPGCKRITPSDTYLKAITQENVRLIKDSIERFDEEGIVTKAGTHFPCDIIIQATGFVIEDALNLYKCMGRGGRDRSKTWGTAPTSYNGIISHGFPNLFMSLGPSTALGHNSIIFMIECQINYAMDCIVKLSKTSATVIEVREDKEKEFIEWQKKNLDKTVFHSGCLAYYQNKSGYAWTLWPRSTTEYWWTTLSCNLSDFILS